MLTKFFSVVLVLSNSLVWTQGVPVKKEDEATIERVKTVKVSSLDRGLPDVTLEFFLKYEGGGAPIEWRISKCKPMNGNSSANFEPNTASCVEAHIDLKDERSVTVVVSKGSPKTRAVGVLKVRCVTVADQSGATHIVDHLSDLPMELHRPPPKSPRDLPLPVGAA